MVLIPWAPADFLNLSYPIPSDVLLKFLSKLVRDVMVTNTDFLSVFSNLYQSCGCQIVNFTKSRNLLVVQIPILFRQRQQQPMNLYHLHKVPVLLGKDTYEDTQHSYTILKCAHDYLALCDYTDISMNNHYLKSCFYMK